MRRTLACAAILLAAAAAVAFWWMALPRDTAAALVRALELAPADAEGAVAIAAPRRTARWLARRPQALLLALAANPKLRDTIPPLRPLALPFVAAARGPLVVFWAGGEAGAVARVSSGARRALVELAGRSNLDVSAGPDWCAVATSPQLLPAGPTPFPLAAPPGTHTALARIGDRLWVVRAGGRTLEAASGAAPALAIGTPGTSTLVLADARILSLWLGLPSGTLGPLRAVMDDSHQWAVALPALHLEGLVRTLVGGPPERVATATPWKGLLGTIWVAEAEGTALASTAAVLDRLPHGGSGTVQGVVHGRHAAWLARRAAAVAGRVPGMPAREEELHRAAALAEGLETLSFRLERDGGRLLLSW